MKFIAKFRRDEDGAVTVDWVVLTAALVALGFLVMGAIGGGAETLADGIAADMRDDITP